MENSSGKIDISVIVPIYNVEEYLEDCLDSIRNQSKDNIEVIMIDDGSTDSSGELAKKYAEKYDGFHYYHEENSGLGRARNYGVNLAKGKYIAFVDSDDLLSEDMYDKMFAAAEKNGSDLTVCNVLRFNSGKMWDSSLHKLMFRNLKLNTHISESPSLIYDTTSWNKLILRSFYIENGFAFPENILYEDIPVTIPMHIKANNVSVVESTYYRWRVRDGASKSITQNTDKLNNLYDRIKILHMLDESIKEASDRAMLRLAHKKALEIDLMIFLNNVKSISREAAKTTFDAVNGYIDYAISDKSIFDELSLIDREKYICAREYDYERLVKLLEYQHSSYSNASVSENDGSFSITAPDEMFASRALDITNELREEIPQQYVESITVDNGIIDIYANVYINRLNIRNSDEQNIKAYLENSYTGCLTELEVVPFMNKKVAENSSTTFDISTKTETKYNYDGTGFRLRLDLNTLEVNENNIGKSRILICYENRLSSGFIRLRATKKISNKSGTMLNDNYAMVEYGALNELELYISSTKTIAESLGVDNDNVSIELSSPADCLYAVANDGSKITFSSDDGIHFTCPGDRFSINTEYYICIGNCKSSSSQLLFKSKRVIIKNGIGISAVFLTNKNHIVRFSVHRNISTVKEISCEGNILQLSTTLRNNAKVQKKIKSAKLFINDDIAGKRNILAEFTSSDNNSGGVSFSIDFNSEEVRKNLYASARELFVEYRLNDNSVITTPIYSASFCKFVMDYNTIELNVCRGINGSLKLISKLCWSKEENTGAKRRALTAKKYPEYMKEPINPKQIIFESMWGSKYSCNPQHLYEYIGKYYPEYECIWSLTDEHTPINGNAVRVRRGSQEYYHYLATAKYFVNNVNFADDYVKRDGQIEIQTMHGTPLKTLGLEVKDYFKSQSSADSYVRRVKRWDYLLVQGEFMKEKAYDCFKFEKNIFECGYPRTDLLYHSSAEKAAYIKQKLNLPSDKKIILYTPTWRTKGAFDLNLDIDKLRNALGDEYILLIRLHHFSSFNDTFEADNKFVFDMSSYSCVEDLYIISDILITDYSSVMFDYALLDKPMLFFLYDLEEYRDNLRGLYVDIEKEAPGPIVLSTREIIDTIKNIDDEIKKCSEKIEYFKKKYLTYENGNSCHMIVNEIIKPDKFTHMKALFKKKLNSFFD